MAYVVDVWYTPPCRKEGAKKDSSSVGIANKLASLQRIATLAITGALHSIATDILDLHAGTRPVRLLLLTLCHRAALRLASLPDGHPLHAIYRTRTRWYVKTHRSPLHELPSIFSIVPNSIETRSPIQSSPTHEMKASVTTLAPSKEDSTVNVQMVPGVIQVFSDSSGLDGQIGAAAVMYRPGSGPGPKTLRYHLGPASEHTVFKAEAVGLLLALHMLSFECDVVWAMIQSDSQVVLMVLEAHTSGPAQNIIDEVVMQIESNWAAARHPAYHLEITWVKGHNGAEGNEKADAEAKVAVGGRTSQRHNLPVFLTESSLPQSIAARRQAFNKVLGKKWA